MESFGVVGDGEYPSMYKADEREGGERPGRSVPNCRASREPGTLHSVPRVVVKRSPPTLSEMRSSLPIPNVEGESPKDFSSLLSSRDVISVDIGVKGCE